MELLLKRFSEKVHLTDELKEAVNKYFKHEKKAKKSVLLKEQQYCNKLYFLESGTIRSYYFYNNLEVSSWFYKEGDFFTSWHSFYAQNPSFEYIEAISDCSIYSISYEDYQSFLKEFPIFEKFARLLAEDQAVFIDQYSKGYMFLSAKERYNLLLEHFPDIELRVKLGQIASLLGISQETLSRIRAGK